MIGRIIKGKDKIYDDVGAGGLATVCLGLNMNTNEADGELVIAKGIGTYSTSLSTIDARTGAFVRERRSPVWMHDDWIAFTACDCWPEASGGTHCGIYRVPSWNGEEPILVHGGSLAMRATDTYGGSLPAPLTSDWTQGHISWGPWRCGNRP